VKGKWPVSGRDLGQFLLTEPHPAGFARFEDTGDPAGLGVVVGPGLSGHDRVVLDVQGRRIARSMALPQALPDC
jgi:hypothetical protein